jgi:hypothetical protein
LSIRGRWHHPDGGLLCCGIHYDVLYVL